MSGELVLVGARERDALSSNSGAAYVFSRDAGAWTEDAKILAPDGVANQLFGSSVSIEGTLAFIGAEGNASNRGAAYVLRQDPTLDRWVFVSKLTASNAESGDQFGSAVALGGASALAGAPQKTLGAEDGIGSAYFFGGTELGPDSDNDGVLDACDNCVGTSNPDQPDLEADSFGDACDNCPAVSNEDQADGDADNVGDMCDNCPADANTDHADTEGDGNGDACDLCPGFDDRLHGHGVTLPSR